MAATQNKPEEREKLDLHVSMKKDAWSGTTVINGDRLVCAALIMNLLDEGCTEINIKVASRS